MKKLVTSLCILSFVAMNTFSFVPLSNQQLNLGSFRLDATAGMFYDELDIISAHPVSLLEFERSRLYTTWGNVRDNTLTTYNPSLSYRGMTLGPADNTFVFGISGDPLGKIGLSNSRMGFVFQNLGSKTNYYDLDNVVGWDSEGAWKDVVSLNVDGSLDGTIDLEAVYEANMKNYANQSINQYNVGFAKKGLILEDLVLGLSVSRSSKYTQRITGGTKSYLVRALNDAGLAGLYAGLPSGTRKLDNYELSYPENDQLDNSQDTTELLAQVRLEPIQDLRVDLGVGLRIQDNYNPNSLTKNAATVKASGVKLNNAGNGALYDTGTAIRDVVTATSGKLDYDDFTGLAGDFVAVNLWTPLWAGGVNAPALSDFSDERKGTGVLLRTEAEYKLFDIPVIGVFNLSLVPQKLDQKQTFVDYIKTQTYNTALAGDPLDTWIARDYTQEVKATGDIKNSNVDFGLKFNIINTDYINVAFGGFIGSRYQLVDFKTTMESTEITSYDDGIATGGTGNLGPGAVDLNTRPQALVGEGIWKQTVKTETTNKNETLTTTMAVPVGAEIPITKKWTFRAGTQYTLIKTKTVNKAIAGKTTTVTSVTPDGGATTTSTVITDFGDELNESTVYEETHFITYTYGIEWSPNPNLTLACNAFLDTNPNIAGSKTTIFDLDTYRLLAIQAIFKF